MEEKKDIDYVEPLKALVEDVYFDIINPSLKKLFSAIALLWKTPISVRYFYSLRIQRAIDRLLERHSIDIVFCFCSTTAEYLFL